MAGKSGDMVFAVDSSTKIQAKGASHKTDAMKDEKKTPQITDFVHTGDTVPTQMKTAYASRPRAGPSRRVEGEIVGFCRPEGGSHASFP